MEPVASAGCHRPDCQPARGQSPICPCVSRQRQQQSDGQGRPHLLCAAQSRTADRQHRKLDNLMVFTDFNKFQIDGPNREICDLEPLADKWRAFNWEVFECDGHSWDDIFNTIEKAKLVKEKPVMIIAHTIKGKGHPAYENKCESHNIRVADAAAHKALLDAISVDGFEWPPR